MEWAIGAMGVALGAVVGIWRMTEALRKDFREEMHRRDESLRAEMNRGYDRLHNDMGAFREQMSTMAEKLGAVAAQSESLRGQVSAMAAQMGAVAAQSESLRGQVSAMAAQMRATIAQPK